MLNKSLFHLIFCFVISVIGIVLCAIFNPELVWIGPIGALLIDAVLNAAVWFINKPDKDDTEREIKINMLINDIVQNFVFGVIGVVISIFVSALFKLFI